MKRNQRQEVGVLSSIFLQSNALCWLCTNSGDKSNMVMIFSTEGRKDQLCDKISNYTPFKLSECNSVSAMVCQACFLNINSWHDFVQFCVKAQQELADSLRTANNPAHVQVDGSHTMLSQQHPQADRHETSGASEKGGFHLTGCDVSTSCTNSSPGRAAAQSQNDKIKLEQVVSECEINKQTSGESKSAKMISTPTGIVTSTKSCTSMKSNCPKTPVTSHWPRTNDKPALKPQGTYCMAKWCRNNAGQHPNISRFRVPKNRSRAEQWLRNAGREDLLNEDIKQLHVKYLCEEHFTEDMFMNRNHNKLVWNAVPMLFRGPKSLNSPQSMMPHSKVYAAGFLQAALPRIDQQSFKRERQILPKTGQALQRKLRTEQHIVQESRTTICNTMECTNVVQSHMRLLPEPHGAKHNTIGIAGEIRSVELKTVPAVGTSSDVLLSEGNQQLAANEVDSTLMTEANQSFITTEVDMPGLESSEPKYTCTFCGEMFLMKSNLVMHQTTYHPGHPVSCEQCGQVEYSTKAEFLEHVCAAHN